MTTIAYFLSGVVMFMIMFIFTIIATEVSEERNIILPIMFVGIVISVIIAYPLIIFFEAIYEKEGTKTNG